uniref:Conserved oligomeric Golgi complex subunit 8 n=2 Tax=Lygus hesperus TaxID=30085 RepID=A0A0A9W2L4_LYGHE
MMDIDTSIKLMFPDGIPEAWIDNPDFSTYLNKLGMYDLVKLRKELDHLSVEKSGILNQTQELAFSNYKTFIQTAECYREIFQQFQKTEKSLEGLLDKVPGFNASCEDFMKTCGEIKAERQINSVSLAKHGQTLQLLEMPQLMDNLIREGHYDDALRLAAYVRKLNKTHGNIPIIQKLCEEIEECWKGLMKRLSWELHSELQLPRCLQVVGVLRRMGVLSELELRLKFLQARDSWFTSVLKQIPKDEPQHLNKVIDVYRMHMFNIITQFRAVFPEQDSILATNKQHFNDYPILHEWINNKVCDFVACCEREMPENGDIVSCLEQVMYFGQSLGRVGADLRGLMAPVFIKKLTNSLSYQIRQTSEQFVADMDKFSLETTSVSSTQPQLMDNQNELSPPEGLINYFPLGRYTNGIISILNQFRLCAPLAIANSMTRMLERSLITVSTTISHFYKREQQAMSIEERDTLTKMVVCFHDCLIPYFQRCLHSLFSPVEIAAFLSVPVFKLQEQYLVFFETDLISAPIQHLLPVTKLDISTLKISSDAATEDSGTADPANVVGSTTQSEPSPA